MTRSNYTYNNAQNSCFAQRKYCHSPKTATGDLIRIRRNPRINSEVAHGAFDIEGNAAAVTMPTLGGQVTGIPAANVDYMAAIREARGMPRR